MSSQISVNLQTDVVPMQVSLNCIAEVKTSSAEALQESTRRVLGKLPHLRQLFCCC